MLGSRALNRALLARQLLLERVGWPVGQVLAHLVGLQAQAPDAPYYGLWSRLAGFRPAELAEALTGRAAVRATMMRGTLHAMTAADCLGLRMLVQPAVERQVRANTDFDGRLVAGVPVDELLAVGAEVLTATPRTAAELRAEFAARWPGRDSGKLSYAVRALLPTVQVPPRGVWGAGGLPRLTPVEAWLGRPVCSDPDPRTLVRRYLAAFGPATAADVAAWSGLTSVRPLLDAMAEQPRVFADERGRELFDLPDAPRPPPDTPAPVRLLAPYDNAVLAHAERARIVPEEYRGRLLTKNGIVPGTVLVDGFVAGMWEVVRRGRSPVRLVVRPFRPLPRSVVDELHGEAEHAAGFAADGGPSEVSLLEPA